MSFELTPQDRHSGLWVRLLEHFNSQLVSKRLENDRDQDAAATAALRAQIKVYKALIALDTAPPEKQ